MTISKHLILIEMWCFLKMCSYSLGSGLCAISCFHKCGWFYNTSPSSKHCSQLEPWAEGLCRIIFRAVGGHPAAITLSLYSQGPSSSMSSLDPPLQPTYFPKLLATLCLLDSNVICFLSSTS